jgi:hypothetical protein
VAKQKKAEPSNSKSEAQEFFDGLPSEPEAAGELDLVEAPPEQGSAQPAEPRMTDPKWHDFVMSQFEADELDNEGHPFVAGLRRVARKLLGPVVESRSTVVQADVRFDPAASHFAGHAVVQHDLVIRWRRHEGDDDEDYLARFTEVADVHGGNTDPGFLRFYTATCATRAEARNLRKALGLKRGCAAEEKTEIPAGAFSNNGDITPSQVFYLDQLCRRLNVNAMAYINAGKAKYRSVSEVPGRAAELMIEKLNEWQGKEQVPEKYQGYEGGWQQ